MDKEKKSDLGGRDKKAKNINKTSASERLSMKKCRKLKSILVAATMCVGSAGSTVALGQEASTDQPQPSTASSQPQVVSKSSQLIGTTVENEKGQKLGAIADVVVNFDTDRVSYCLLGVKHGIFGKTKFLPVPLAAFRPSEDGSCLILNASKANLAKARGYARNEWPSTMTPAWGAEPAPPEVLPAVDVFAPPPPPPQPVLRTRYWDPVWGPPFQPRNASEAVDVMAFQMQFGYGIR